MRKFLYYGTYIHSSWNNAHDILFILTKMQKAYETMLRQNIFLFSLLAVSPLHLWLYNCMISSQAANYVNYFRNKRGLLGIENDKSSYFLFSSNNLILLVSINTRVVNRCIQYIALYSHFDCPKSFY